MPLSYPSIRIHIWGGLGSQLFAWGLFLDLQESYPNRKFLLIFHNGGVTRREPELLKHIHGCKFKIVNDFDPASTSGLFKNFIVSLPKAIGWSLRIFPRITGFLACADNDMQFNKLKPWLISLRGHYSNRLIRKEVSDKIFKELFADLIMCNDLCDFNVKAIHFRLGDLVDLGSKKPISGERIIDGLVKSSTESEIDLKILVLSDSPEMAIKRLTTYGENLRFTSKDVPPRETIYVLTRATIFVGSPSKISEWVAIFRSHSNQRKVVWLPIEMQAQMEKILGARAVISYF